MTAFEKDVFSVLVAGYGAESDVVPMNDKRVLTSAQDGDNFRTELFRVQESVLGPTGLLAEDLDDRAVALLNAAVEDELRGAGAAIKLDGLTVVGGKGLYLAGSEVGEAYYEPVILAPQERIFGWLAGVSFNSYPFVPGIDVLPPDYDGEVEVDSRQGLVMALASAMVCEAEGCGFVQDTHKYAMIPLPEHTLTIFGGEILD